MMCLTTPSTAWDILSLAVVTLPHSLHCKQIRWWIQVWFGPWFLDPEAISNWPMNFLPSSLQLQQGPSNTEVGIYKRKQESKKKRTRPRKQSRKQENDQEKKKNLFSLIIFLVEFLLSCFLTFLFSFINSHLCDVVFLFMLNNQVLKVEWGEKTHYWLIS